MCPVQLQCLAWATRQDVRGRKAFGLAGRLDGVIGGQLFGAAQKWADASRRDLLSSTAARQGEDAADNEVWATIPNWESLYSISTLGRVRSEPRIVHRRNGTTYRCQGGILKLWRHRRGDCLSVHLARPVGSNMSTSAASIEQCSAPSCRQRAALARLSVRC